MQPAARIDSPCTNRIHSSFEPSRTPGILPHTGRKTSRAVFEILVGLFSALLFSGCANSFHFTPGGELIHVASPKEAGLAIGRGSDSRPDDEIRPDWSRNANKIVARALAVEAAREDVFHRVKIGPRRNLAKFSKAVDFNVRKFECYNQPSRFEQTGRELLRFGAGVRGALISASIPSKFTVEVEIEFQLQDTASGRTLFTKTYSASRVDYFNGYQGEDPKMRLTSAALDKVLRDFLRDASRF